MNRLMRLQKTLQKWATARADSYKAKLLLRLLVAEGSGRISVPPPIMALPMGMGTPIAADMDEALAHRKRQKEADQAVYEAKLGAILSAPSRAALQRVPDYVDTLVGYRSWHVGFGGGTLGSLNPHFGLWSARSVNRAVCQIGSGFTLPGESPRLPAHAAPQMGCECGYWAFKSAESLAPHAAEWGPSANDVIWGAVYLWGRVIECELGYRAEYAYPKELWLLNPDHEELGITYGVPVRVPTYSEPSFLLQAFPQ